MDIIEVIHVGDVNINTHEIFKRAPRSLDSFLQVFAHLLCLRLDVADADQNTFLIARQHARYENEPLCLNRDG